MKYTLYYCVISLSLKKSDVIISGNMNLKEKKNEEFEAVLGKFARFINSNIYKFNLQKSGLDPDDIYQEVRIKIWKLLCNEKKIENYASYIRKIVDSSVIDQLRKLRREEGAIILEKKERIAEQKRNYTENNFNIEDSKRIVGQAVESLIESRRKVVRLFLLNMNIDEISLVFDWSKDKTRNLLYRGLSDLKKKLKNKGIEYEIKR